MVDIGRNDRKPVRHLLAHKFRRHKFRYGCPKTLPFRQLVTGILYRLLAAQVFALRDIDHLFGDDTGARKLKLRDRSGAITLVRPVHNRESTGEMFLANIAVIFGPHITAFI